MAPTPESAPCWHQIGRPKEILQNSGPTSALQNTKMCSRSTSSIFLPTLILFCTSSCVTVTIAVTLLRGGQQALFKKGWACT